MNENYTQLMSEINRLSRTIHSFHCEMTDSNEDKIREEINRLSDERNVLTQKVLVIRNFALKNKIKLEVKKMEPKEMKRELNKKYRTLIEERRAKYEEASVAQKAAKDMREEMKAMGEDKIEAVYSKWCKNIDEEEQQSMDNDNAASDEEESIEESSEEVVTNC